MINNNNESHSEKGFLFPLVSSFINFTSIKTGRLFQVIKKGQYPHDANNPTIAKSIARRVDVVNIVSIAAGVIIYVVISSPGIQKSWTSNYIAAIFKYLLLVIIFLRFLNIVTWLLRPLFVESRSKSKQKVLSFERNLFFAFFHYLELIVYFAIVYTIYGNYLIVTSGNPDSFTSLYFSAITQLTIGYGEIQPTAGLRLIAIVQALTGLLIVALTIGSLIPHLHFSQIEREKDNN